MGRVLVAGAVVAVALLGGCSSGGGTEAAEPSPSPVESPTAARTAPLDCPKLDPGWVPADLSLAETVALPQGPAHVAERVTYRDGTASRELSFLSGVAGQVGEGLTPEGTVTVEGRGQSARLLASGDTTVAVWQEAPEGDPCRQYAVIALGLSQGELQQVLDALR